MAETSEPSSSVEDSNLRYPKIELHDYEPRAFPPLVPKEVDRCERNNNNGVDDEVGEDEKKEMVHSELKPSSNPEMNNDVLHSTVAGSQKHGKFFIYDAPVSEETGFWIPVSVPPLPESEHENWASNPSLNGGYLPDADMDWNHFVGENKELTMWDVVTEMVIMAGGKVKAIASGDFHQRQLAWLSANFLEQAWKEMAQTLTEATVVNVQEILEAEPPRWLPDSSASACMLCSVRFHPIICSRHHCRFCGGLFCSECSKGRSLLPAKFRISDPQRVCDVCCVRLESVQGYLMDQVSRAAQLPTYDLTDLSTLRSWLNFPWSQSMEYEIYKATNALKSYNKMGARSAEKCIPDAILKQAKGLAILTVAKVGTVMTYKVGTGLVIARRKDGSWSAPSAIASFGLGWGVQVGGQCTDFIIVLRTSEAVKMFGGNMHISFGAGMSAAAGVVGRSAEADIRAGDGGVAACYTYSSSKGAFVGCSFESNIVTARHNENSRFYGNSSLKASDILLGPLPRPPAAAILYDALSDLYQNL
ncbi:hypothetical protein SOVF_000870 [Spinacia oleracea]|uniref:FYVE-type domain-containing protein n=1 Tax=Spinacia oleracea TaxID=3562 RepID=A0A9R0HZT0_SPIOL|nr:uncharacterized protein LOC110779877 [Spinacia oleracea]KNA25983.1 hypothetical protein SOVF_000870 [Spinacia oleracea]